MTYTQVETAKTLYLPESNVLLVGIIDAEGDNFFSEYKTANPRGAKTWKREWLLSTQALTYGLLTGGDKPFLVRKAFKGREPSYDHEWFKFTPGDLDFWRRQVNIMADEIKRNMGTAGLLNDLSLSAPWRTNITHGCNAYGPNYMCPYWAEGCTKLNFGPVPGVLPFDEFPEFTGENRAILYDAIQQHPNALVLSKTRMENYSRCPEKYRKDLLYSWPASDAALLGSRFHDLVAQYNRALIAQRTGEFK